MNGKTGDSQPHYPSLDSPTPKETAPFHQETQPHQPGPSSSSAAAPPPYDGSAEKWGTPTKMNGKTGDSQPYYPSLDSPTPKETAPFHQETQPHQPGPSSSSSAAPPPYDGSAEKWGTHIMGTPAVPTCHPDNKKAALWGAGGDFQQTHHQPYLQYTPIEKPSSSPMESVLNVFNNWGNKAETMATNIWQNLKTGSSIHGAAWGKMNLTAKAISGGGFESLYKQTFTTHPGEKLKKTFACYLSTTTGPVAGTLYLSNVHVAFCSDRPLSFTAPSGQETWSYYKVIVPLGKIGTINPVNMRDNQTEKYIQMVTIDGHDFWFMGFVNHEKASRHLSESLSNFVVSGIAAKPVVA